MAAGWRLGADGFGALSHGPSLAVRGGLGRWALELSYAAGLGRELTLGGATLQLREHRAVASLQHRLPLGARLGLVAGLGGGLLALQRTTSRLPDTLDATAAQTTFDGLLLASVALRWDAAHAGRTLFGLELEGAACALLAPLTLRVQTAGGPEQQSAWRVQPSARLQLFVQWPRLSAR